MQIVVSQSALSQALARSQSVLERKSTRPILENILLEAYDDTLLIAATDLRVSLTQRFACQVGRPGTIAVPGRKLHEVVREIPTEDLTIDLKDNQWVTITSGKGVFHLPGAPAEEYPTLPAEPDTFIAVPAGEFRRMLDRTLFAASSDESRPYLCGVFVKIVHDATGKPALRMVATDGHRLARVDRHITPALGSFESGVIVPRKGLTELKGLLDGSVENFDLAEASGRVFARVGGSCLAMSLIDASFPNYEQVIPAEAPHLLRMDRVELTNALRRVSLLSDQETHSVVLQATDDQVVLSSTNPQFGDAREELAGNYDGDKLRVAFNAAYVVESLRALEGEEVVLSVTDPLSPCLIRSSDDPQTLCVVMPMRVD